MAGLHGFGGQIEKLPHTEVAHILAGGKVLNHERLDPEFGKTLAMWTQNPPLNMTIGGDVAPPVVANDSAQQIAMTAPNSNLRMTFGAHLAPPATNDLG